MARPKDSGEGFKRQYVIRFTEEMFDDLKQAAIDDGVRIAEKIREYIEWGLENDKE